MGIWPAIVFSLTLPAALEEASLNALRAAVAGRDLVGVRKTLTLAEALAGRPSVHGLINECLPKSHGDVRLLLASRLPGYGRDETPRVPALVATLLDPKSPNRSGAAITLGWMGPAAVGAVPALKLCLRPDNAPPPPPLVRRDDPAFPELDGMRIVEEFRVKLGPGPEPVGDVSLRLYACTALWRIERKTDTVLPVLRAALAGGWPEEQTAALSAIGVIGVDLKADLGPQVLAVVSSDRPEVRHRALSLVPAFAADPDAAAKLLVAALRRGDAADAALLQSFHDGKLTLEQYAYARHLPTDRGPAAAALRTLGPAAVGPLLPLLDDPVSQLSAVVTLGGLGKAGRPAVAALLKLATGPASGVRYEARRALESIEKE